MARPILYYSNEQSLRLYKKQQEKELDNEIKQLEKNEAMRIGNLYNEEEAKTLAALYAKVMEKTKFIKEPILSMEQNIRQLIKEKEENKPLALTYEDVPLLTQPVVETKAQILPRLEEKKAQSAPTSPNKRPFVDLGELQQRISLDPDTVKLVNSLKVQELKQKLTDAGITYPSNIKKQELRNIIFREIPKNKINLTGKGIKKIKNKKKYKLFS